MGKFNAYRREVKSVLETVLGTTPASALKKLKVLGGGMDAGILSVPDGQVNTDGMASEIVELANDAAGSYQFNLRYGELDNFFQSALRKTWSTATSLSSAAVAAKGTSNWFSLTSAIGFSNNMTIGQIILTAGFTNAANNGLAEITALTANKITVSGLTLATEEPGQSVTMKGKYAKNANTVYGLTIEEEFLDITKFHAFTGCVVDKLSISAKNKTKVAVTATLKAFKGAEGVATVGTGAESAAATTIPMNCNAQMTNFWLNGAALAVGCEELTIDIDNKMVPDDQLTSANPVGFAPDEISVTGKMRLFFEGSTEYAYYRNLTALKISAIFKDAANNYIAFTVARVKVTGCKKVAGNTKGRGMLDMTFTGTRNTTTNCVVQIDTFAA